MNLFVNAITKEGILILFNNNKKILAEKKIKILGNESSKLISEIDLFLKSNKINYNILENIIVVNGPGSFTGVRTIILAINTINFIINKNITAINFFDLFNKYPIIKSSSKRDLFVKYKKNDIISIVKNDIFLEEINKNNIKKIYGDLSNEISPNLKIDNYINYQEIIKNIKFQNNKKIEALYIKKPNIC